MLMVTVQKNEQEPEEKDPTVMSVSAVGGGWMVLM